MPSLAHTAPTDMSHVVRRIDTGNMSKPGASWQAARGWHSRGVCGGLPKNPPVADKPALRAASPYRRVTEFRPSAVATRRDLRVRPGPGDESPDYARKPLTRLREGLDRIHGIFQDICFGGIASAAAFLVLLRGPQRI